MMVEIIFTGDFHGISSQIISMEQVPQVGEHIQFQSGAIRWNTGIKTGQDSFKVKSVFWEIHSKMMPTAKLFVG